MIEAMSKYSFVILSEDKEKFLSELQAIGLIDITRSQKPIDDKSSELLQKAEKLQQAIYLLESIDYAKENLPTSNLSIDDSDLADLVLANHQEILAKEIEVEALRNEIDILKVWGNYDISKRKDLENLGYYFHFYNCAKKLYQKQWEEDYNCAVITEKDSQVFFVIINNEKTFNFEIKELEKPQRTYAQALEEMKELEEEVLQLKSNCMELKSMLFKLKHDKHLILSDLDLYLANKSSNLVAENYISLFEGFAPKEDDKKLSEIFDNMDNLIYFKDSAIAEDNPPIKLKNNWFTSMFTVLTDMYGRPAYNEFDPTPYLSIFFLLFFSMCLADTGYGLILFILGFVIARKEAYKDIGHLVSTLGVGTIIMGFVLHTCFGIDLSDPALSIVPAWAKHFMLSGEWRGYRLEMILSIIVGIIHLCLAMIVKTVYATKKKGFLYSISVWSWTIFIVSAVIVGVLAIINLLPIEIVKWIIIGIGSVCAIGILFFNNIKKNPIVNIGSGLWSVYETATGLLGDVLSYLRLYALGLAGGMLGNAFNKIAWMTMGQSFGFKFQLIAFILILLVGHGLNLCMCCLGAFVHPLRLNFLEFFKNSSYTGKGKAYKPVCK